MYFEDGRRLLILEVKYHVEGSVSGYAAIEVGDEVSEEDMNRITDYLIDSHHEMRSQFASPLRCVKTEVVGVTATDHAAYDRFLIGERDEAGKLVLRDGRNVYFMKELESLG